MYLIILSILASIGGLLITQLNEGISLYMGIGISIPGISFIIFLHSFFKLRSSVLSTALLFLIWMSSYLISVYTFGLLVPFVGALNAWIIGKYLLKVRFENNDLTNLNLFAFFSSLIGLIIFYFLVNNGGGFWLSMTGIVSFWQLAVGIVLLNQIKND